MLEETRQQFRLVFSIFLNFLCIPISNLDATRSHHSSSSSWKRVTGLQGGGSEAATAGALSPNFA